MNKDIVVIVPLHEYNEDVNVMLDKAIKSVPVEYNVVISTVENIAENVKLQKFVSSFSNVSVIYEDKNSKDYNKSDFCTLVNNGARNEHEWFTVLEYDDCYTSTWFNNVEKYIEYMPEVSVFLPLTELLYFSDNKFIGYGNEAPWASSFSNDIGYIDNDCLQQYFDFYLTGGVFNTEDWINQGGLKPSIKISFWYEFLLRITNNNKKVFVIPKLGYKHYVDRENSLYDVYRKTIDEKESTWYFELAKQECFHKKDRNKVYENNEEKGE